MIAIASLLVVLLISIVVVRVASVALTLTGMSRTAAQFQARSAWTGTGFTTAESEQVVSHPVRRRIITWLILGRSVGLVTVASTLMLSFVNVEDRAQGLIHFALLVLGLLGLVWFARSQIVGSLLEKVISRALRRYTTLDTRDYVGLLHLRGEYGLVEFTVREGGWLAGKSLQELALPQEGILVLGLTTPGGEFLGAPHGATVLRAGDRVMLYGRNEALAALDRRRQGWAGEAERRQAVAQQTVIEAEEEEKLEGGAVGGAEAAHPPAPSPAGGARSRPARVEEDVRS